MARQPSTYWEYIRTEEILALQGGLADDEGELSNDEVVFIVVHQIDELWFKLVLRELEGVRDLFASGKVPEQMLSSAVRGLRRTVLLFEQLASHFGLMETLTTRDYLGFRDKLIPASGFQSAQMREIEILMGLRPEERIPLGHERSYMDALKNPDGTPSPAFRRVERRLNNVPSLLQALDDWLYRTPIQGSMPDMPGDDAVVERFLDDYMEAQRRDLQSFAASAVHEASTDADKLRLEARYKSESESARRFLLAEDLDAESRPRRVRIRAALLFIESYRELPLLAWPREVIDAIVALEQAFVISRQRHARMVERVIGRRTGTGGSAGVDYLDRTALRYRIFHDFWAVRTLLIRRPAMPPLEHPEVYGFKTGE
ncbi:MAG: tryptophan 2,3-dioxygenase family protein [Nannocystaceae bacterium]